MPDVNHRRRIVIAALIILLAAAASPVSRARTGTSEEASAIEVTPATTSLLKFLNTAPEAKLRDTAGLNAEVIKKLLAHRAAGGKFKNLVEFTNATGIMLADLQTLLQPYVEQERAHNLEAERDPVPEPSARSKGGRLQKNPPGAATADPNSAGARTAGPIGAVRPGFYSKLPGYENLDKLDPLKKTEFLETINHEMCSCGCKGETVAYCLVNDPGCPVVRQRAKKIYDDIMTKAPR